MSKDVNILAAKGSTVLTINGGSSSIKFSLFAFSNPLTRIFSGQIERIGRSGTRLVVTGQASATSEIRVIDASKFSHAAARIIAYLLERPDTSGIAGIGHRVVHGGLHLISNQLIDKELIEELRRNQPLDLAHLPREIALIEAFCKAFPALPQIACFDTAFHRDLPRIAQLLPIPRRYFEQGIRRFGFHGLSYTYLMDRLAALAGAEAARGRIILAHLGSGASMAAVHQGKPVDTTMAFTPTGGLVMGTRPGDMDPGLLAYLMRVEKMSPEQMDDFISRQCGLIGLSGTSSDMRDLLERRASDPRAADAINVFCYQAKKFIGALTAVLGGLDTLIFSGGIGEHAAEVRAGICEDMDFLGLKLDPAANAEARDVISVSGSSVAIRVIPTDEESVIAKTVAAVLQTAP